MGGNLVATTGGAGAITQAGALTVTGTSSFTAGAANSITLNNAANNFGGTVSIVSGNNATLVDINAIDIGASTLAGLFTVTAGGAISDSAAISAASLVTSSVGGTVLDFGHTVGVFNATNITSGNVQLVNAGALNVSGISQAGGGNVTVGNTGALSTSGAIATAANGNIGLTATGATLTIGNTVTAGGSGTVNLTSTGAASDVLTNAAVGSTTGAVTISAGRDFSNTASMTTGATLTATAGNNISNTGAGLLRGAGGVTLTTGAGGLLTNSGSISNNLTASAVNLTADNMALTGTVIGGSGNVTLTSATAGQGITLGGGLAGLGLSQAELNTISTTGILQVGTAAHTGAITVDGPANLGAGVGSTVLLRNGSGDIAINALLQSPNPIQLNTTSGSITDSGTGMVKTASLISLTAGGNIGTAANPLHTTSTTPTTQLTATAGGGVGIINDGNLNLNGVSASGAVVITANDIGAGGDLNVGGTGITSGGGSIKLHSADNLTILSGVSSGNGAIEMIAGTGPGLNALAITNPATEGVADDNGLITLNATVNAGGGNILLVSSTTGTNTIIDGVVQNASGTVIGNDLTVVTLRGLGGANQGGAAIRLDQAPTTNSSNSIYLFACAIDGCPTGAEPFAHAPMIKVSAQPLYADGPIFYSDSGGTNVSGVGTVNDFTFFTPGDVTFATNSLQARNLRIEASQDIFISLASELSNADINGGLPGGSITFVAGRDIFYTPAAAGNTIGNAVTPFNHNLKFIAADDVELNNSIFLGNSVFTIQANQSASINGGAIITDPTAWGNDGSVLMRGNHIVKTGGDIAISGKDLTILGGDLGSANQTMTGQQLIAGGSIALNMTDDVLIQAGTSTAASDSAAIVSGGQVAVGTALQRVNNLTLLGGSNSVNAGINHHSDAILRAGSGSLMLAGNLTMTGGSADITGNGANDAAQSTALAKIDGVSMNILGNVLMTGGTATAANGVNSGSGFAADASAVITGDGAFTVAGNWTMQGGNSSANAASGKAARAGAEAQVSSSSINATIGGTLTMNGGTASADTSAGGTLAQANADAIWSPGAAMTLDVTGTINMTGGNSTIVGASASALALAGTESSTSQVGSLLKVKSDGNINLTAGTETGGTEARSNAALFYGGEIKIMLGGGTLTLTGDAGSGLFQFLSPQLLRVDGKNYPVTVSGGSVQFVLNTGLGDALVLSGAPPLNLGSLQSPLLVALNSSQQARIDSYATAKAFFDQQNAGKKLCN
ncbi:MAG: beta strand repeat-containing protein [Burkholderiales bacterium]